ncbi:MAG: class I SAM-dependent methyltransferase [Candidatus Thermoplasmatota archaeon]|nr:class I SAM-dependent methyltransferase [Candidatus Thermoplasmatota archaeon]
MTRLPVSLQSLFIQGAAALVAVALNSLLHILLSYQAALWQFALMQGAAAAGLSALWRQPAWWLPLHLGFLPGVLLAQRLHVSNRVYLAAFVLLMLFYWSSFRTRVPLYLSDRKAWRALASLLPRTRPFRFIDLGSGLGGVLFYLEPRFPRGRWYGTEIAPAPWLISRVRAWFKRSRVAFMRRDYASLDLADFEVVFAFLSPAAMPALWQQAQAQMRSGSLFVSLSFLVNARQPDHVVTLAEGERHTLYAWRM